MVATRNALLYVFLAAPARLSAGAGRLSDRLQRPHEPAGRDPRQHRRVHAAVRRARQLPRGPGRSRLPQGLRQLAVVRRCVNVIGQLGIGLALALFFSQRFPGAHFLRGLLLASWMLPALVVGALWKWMFATQYGVVNFVLRGIGHRQRVPCTGCRIPRCRAHLRHHRQRLVRHAVQHDPGRGRADRHPAGTLRGRRARRRRAVARFRYITLPAIRPALLAIACL